jgi:hypothetical protein
MKLDEKVSSDFNKERVDVWTQVPGVGYTEVQEVLDFSGQVLTVYLPVLKVCKKYKIPEKIVLKDLITQFMNPDSQLIVYDGEETLPWSGEKDYYTFEIHKSQLV